MNIITQDNQFLTINDKKYLNQSIDVELDMTKGLITISKFFDPTITLFEDVYSNITDNSTGVAFISMAAAEAYFQTLSYL